MCVCVFYQSACCVCPSQCAVGGVCAAAGGALVLNPVLSFCWRPWLRWNSGRHGSAAPGDQRIMYAAWRTHTRYVICLCICRTAEDVVDEMSLYMKQNNNVYSSCLHLCRWGLFNPLSWFYRTRSSWTKWRVGGESYQTYTSLNFFYYISSTLPKLLPC